MSLILGASPLIIKENKEYSNMKTINASIGHEIQPINGINFFKIKLTLTQSWSHKSDYISIFLRNKRNNTNIHTFYGGLSGNAGNVYEFEISSSDILLILSSSINGYLDNSFKFQITQYFN
ncbi:hypothetical protein [Campylobacter coli]|uniref:hypothetical protein n=1 Tax=Campylobacter coli TaxID=195 RepID=UPI0011A310F2|nr:hypothetical protein [Campylobacter coli]